MQNSKLQTSVKRAFIIKQLVDRIEVTGGVLEMQHLQADIGMYSLRVLQLL